MQQTTNDEGVTLSSAQKMTIEIAIESLEFLKQVSVAAKKPVDELIKSDLEKFVSA